MFDLSLFRVHYKFSVQAMVLIFGICMCRVCVEDVGDVDIRATVRTTGVSKQVLTQPTNQPYSRLTTVYPHSTE